MAKPFCSHTENPALEHDDFDECTDTKCNMDKDLGRARRASIVYPVQVSTEGDPADDGTDEERNLEDEEKEGNEANAAKDNNAVRF